MTGEKLYGSLDNGTTWVDITDKVTSGTTISWDGVTLTGSGTIKIEVRDAEDRAGTASSQTYTLDTTAPQLSSITDNVDGVASSAITYTFNFDGPVTGFAANDVSVSAGTKGAFTKVNDSQYTLVVTPPLVGGSIETSVTGAFQDAAGNDGVASVTNTQESAGLTAGQAVINLGTYGKLINPVQVDGDHWFYYWDKNNDGLATYLDMASIDTLETLFFGSNTGTVMSESNRTWTYDGLTMKLPTMSGDFVGAWDWKYANDPNGLGLQNTAPNGTVVSDSSVNSTYDDMVAIWDALNGSGTTNYYSGGPSGSAINGLPTGWANNAYLTATMHPQNIDWLQFFLGYGSTNQAPAGSNGFVALEVVFPVISV